MSGIALVLLFLGGAVLTIGDIFMKKWVGSGYIGFYVFGMIIYIVGLNFLAQSFKYKNIAVASVIFVIFNVMILSVVSWLYFKEQLSLFQITGILLGLVSVSMLELSENGS